MNDLAGEKDQLQGQHTYRMDLAYVGTGFSGWQSQPSLDSVQDELERVLQIIFRDRQRILGASRTDAGVHAEHQVASFRLSKSIDDTSKVIKSINALVDPRIKVFRLEPVNTTFHPIMAARAKLYRYRLWLGPITSPFASDYVWPVNLDLNIAAMMEAASAFVGKHDFAAFCASDSAVKTTVREVYDLQIHQRGVLVDIYILGSGFLKQMVRSMVGTLVEVGRGRRSAESISAIINSQDRTQAGQTAPARGLSLVEIFYEDCPSWSIENCKPLSSLSFWIHSSL